MSAARVNLTWSPDEQRKRVRRSAAATVVIIVALLWGLSAAETPSTTTDTTKTSTTSTIATTSTATTTTTASTDTSATAVTSTTSTTQPPAVVPSLSVSTSEINFGDQPVGTASKEQPMQFENKGPVAFAATGVAFLGEPRAFEVNLGDCLNVAPGGTCNAAVTFHPVAVRDEKVQVVLLDGTGARSDPSTLHGRGTQPLPPPPPPWHHVAFDASMIEVPRGTTASPTIRNNGEDEAVIGAVKLDDVNGFRMDPAQCQAGRKLLPGETCLARITALRDTRPLQTTLRLYNSKGQLEDVATVMNFGLVAQPPSPPWHHVAFDLSLIVVSNKSAQVVVHNLGQDIANIEGITSDDDSFKIMRDGCAKKQLTPNEGCEAIVVLALDRGLRTGNLTLRNQAGKEEDRAAVTNAIRTAQSPLTNYVTRPAVAKKP